MALWSKGVDRSLTGEKRKEDIPVYETSNIENILNEISSEFHMPESMDTLKEISDWLCKPESLWKKY